jgi:outer membrane protein OmpA-like peptidoglycan-associated protein
MKAIRWGWLTAVLLAACAGPSQREAFSPNASLAGGPQAAATVPPEQQFDFMHDLNRRLQQALAQDDKSPLKPLLRADGLPSVRLDGHAFRGDSGELDPSALTPVGNLAHVLANTGPCVIHVLGERLSDEGAPGADLGERRATALVAVLGSLGVPQARLRAESRLQPGSTAGVIIVVRPVVAGHEAEAWTPPPVEG